MDDEQIRRLAAALRNMGWLVPVGAIRSALHAEKLCLVEADTEIERLKAALDLAVGMLMLHEPGDSRAVSDEAVALASVVCDCTNDETWRIISAGQARLAKGV
jgi:hypothetical protein